MTVLTRNAIRKEMANSEDPLVITPVLDREQVGASSVDVRLGHQFIVLRRAAVTHVDPTDHEGLRSQIQRSQHQVRLSLHQGFIIHPGQLALGATLEYLSLPRRLTATVEGRSSWGRLGLVIATACNVDPGFKGCITLELVNNGEAPLVLYPGVRIAQFVFHRAEEEADYRHVDPVGPGKYDCPIGPQFSRIDRDQEIPFWGQLAMPISVRKPTPDEESHMRTWPTWELEPSEFPWHYDNRETCLLSEGEVTVEAPGQTVSLGPGDCAVFPQGLVCTWKVRTKIRKHFRFG